MRARSEHVVINGSHGEGGGALLRTALAMSALTQQPVRIHSVRGAMRKTGLNSEDLTFLTALTMSCRADVEGDDLDSPEILFAPSRAPRALEQQFDISSYQKGAAIGSSCVVAEALIPVLARAGAYSKISIVGETYGQNTLSFDAFERTTLALHRRQGVCAFSNLTWAGFGATARGDLSMEVEPSLPLPMLLKERGQLVGCHATISVAEIPEYTVARGEKHVRALFSRKGLEVEIETIQVRSRAPGVSMTLWAEFEQGAGSGSSLGQRGLRMETVAENAFHAFEEWFDTDATVDAFVADQILPIAVLAEGTTIFSTPRITRRLVTMAWVIKQFIPVHITIKGQEGYPGTITVER